VLRRFGPKAVLPATVLAVAIGLMMMFAAHRPDPAPPEAAPPPPSPQPSPVAPQAQAPPPVNIVDTAFVAALKHDGVPVPSDEYVTSHGHAVCDFLARQPDFTDAVRYVQQSSVWDANQSASVTAGAVVSYCPQYQPSSPGELQPGMQNALSDLQALERDLQGIQGDLKGIRDGLPALPGGQ
jgi:hypothetical protein